MGHPWKDERKVPATAAAAAAAAAAIFPPRPRLLLFRSRVASLLDPKRCALPPSIVHFFFAPQMDLGQEDGRRFFSLSSADRRVSSASSAPSDPVDIPGAAARRGSGNGDSGAAGGEPNTTTSLQEVCLWVHIIDIVCTFFYHRFFFLRERVPTTTKVGSGRQGKERPRPRRPPRERESGCGGGLDCVCSTFLQRCALSLFFLPAAARPTCTARVPISL